MFDPSKLDIDFSNASDEDIQKYKEAKRQEELKHLEPTAELQSPGTNELQASVQAEADPLQTIDEPEIPVVIEAKKDPIDQKIDHEQQETKQAENLQLKKKDTQQLSTIITDTELVEQDDALKSYNEEKQLAQQQEKLSTIEFDILIKSLNDIVDIILKDWHDYVRIEPSEQEVKLTFVKDWVDKDIKYIKYPVYSAIVLQAKSAGKLKLEITTSEQKWTWSISHRWKSYKTAVKTNPHDFGESVFFKINETAATLKNKKKEKLSFTKVLWYLLALLFTSLILWAVFLGFILFSSNSVADLKFFQSFGIDVGQVREFVSGLVNVVFLIIVFIETIFAWVFIFKAILTKKEFKKKKINSIILWISLTILTLATAFAWITLSTKINELKWENYGRPVIYDNIMLNSDFFSDPREALIDPSGNIIGPVTLKFEIDELLQRVRDNGNTIQWITWVFDDESIRKPANSTDIIREFTQIWSNTITLELEITDIAWEETVIEEEIADFDILSNVDVTVRNTKNGWKRYSFDASSLGDQWNIAWYYIPDLSKRENEEKQVAIEKALQEPIFEWYVFSPAKAIFEEEIIVWMDILDKESDFPTIDKIFLMSGDGESDIEWSIGSRPSISDDLQYTLFIEEVENAFAGWFIEEVTWIIGDTRKTITVDPDDLQDSSEYLHEFEEYGDQRVIAVLTDTSGNEKTIETVLDIQKQIKLKSFLSVYNDITDEELGSYNENTKEYSIYDLWVPVSLRFDARFVTPTKQVYRLKNIDWDFDGDGNSDETGKIVTRDFEKIWEEEISVTYTFEHRTIDDETITHTDTIYIETVKKDVQLDLQIEKTSNYVPQIVRFDASKSRVNGDDIEKFTYDYWDGTPKEVRDAINPGHKYLEAWTYKVTIEAQTKKWKTYKLTKTLNLLEQPQEIKISSSLKRADAFQDIDFYSDESNGQITSFFWEFWDGATSTTANPRHKFEEPGEYEVKLTWTFANNNIEEDTIQITIE